MAVGCHDSVEAQLVQQRPGERIAASAAASPGRIARRHDLCCIRAPNCPSAEAAMATFMSTLKGVAPYREDMTLHADFEFGDPGAC
jgi:hypothetical protein